MIIRAVSVSDDELDDAEGNAHPLRAGTPAADRRLGVKLAWFSTTIALAALLLVDLAAILNAFQRQDPNSQEMIATRDAFALVPAMLDAWFSSQLTNSSVVAVLFAAPATALNTLLGYAGVAAWIFTRETSARIERHRSARGGSSRVCSMGSPWVVIVGVLCFGHVVSCVYVLVALLESDGDRTKFFLGKARSNRTYPRV